MIASYCCAARCTHRDRRSFLRLAGGAAAFGIAVGAPLSNVAIAAALTRAQRDKLTPDEIIALAKRGNVRFRQRDPKDRNRIAEQRASASGQYPAAVVLGCVDSRAPAELILDLGIGDIFNARVAGNIANPDILGSMEFACKVSGAKVVLVMGHTSCGAIKGAIDDVQLGNLTGLLAKIKPAVAATTYAGDRSSKNAEFVDAVARRNVELTLADIRANSPILREMENAGAVKFAGSMYNLQTAVVDFF